MHDTFQAFRPHFNTLARVGYFKIVPNTEVKWKRTLHFYYRIFVWICILTYNAQHVIRAIQLLPWLPENTIRTLSAPSGRKTHYVFHCCLYDPHPTYELTDLYIGPCSKPNVPSRLYIIIKDWLNNFKVDLSACLSHFAKNRLLGRWARNSTKQLVGTLFILLTTLNTLGKQLSFNIRMQRVETVIDVINSSLFKPKNVHHDNILRANASSMSRLLTIYHTAIFICTLLFIGYPLIDKALGNDVYLTGYFPFDTSPSPMFELVVIYLGILISLQAYGHVTMDCTIVAFYSYAKTQLQILRYNFEHIVDEVHVKEAHFKYFIDNDSEFREILHKKLVYCIKHYDQIIWYVKEVESIFNEAMIVHFIIVAWVICMTLYKIVGLPLFSAEFISMAMYLGCMLSQLFIYCYYGTHLKEESELVNESIYRSGWLSLSPGFRRKLLVLMERYKCSIEPRTARVIPLSVDTYISVLRSSYALFTILDRK